MVRDGRFKLIRSLEDPDLLYDLQADPRELTDLSGTPEHADTVARLRRVARRAGGPRGAVGRAGPGQPARAPARVGGAAPGASGPTGTSSPASDASRRYVRNRDDLYELQRRSRLEMGDPDAF